MALYLVQHGKSLPKETDPDHGLSDEGVADTRGTVRLALDLGLRVGGILHSGKTRAQQTAEILAAALHPPEGIKEAQGLNPLDDVTPLDFPETGRRPHAGRPPALHGAAGGVVGVRFAGEAGYRVPEQRHRLLGPRRDQRQLGDPLGTSSEAWMKLWCLGFWVFGYWVVQNTFQHLNTLPTISRRSMTPLRAHHGGAAPLQPSPGPVVCRRNRRHTHR